MLYTVLSYSIPILGLVIIGFITVHKNTRQPVNVLFFLLSSTIALWLSALFIGDLTINAQISLWAVRTATFIGTPIAPLILYLGNMFPVQIKKPTWRLDVFAIAPSVIFMATAFTPLLIPKIALQSHSAQPEDLGLLYTLQSLFLLACFVVSIIIMIRKFKHVNSRQRSQIKLVIFGLVVAVLVNVITGLFLTTLNQANNFSNLAGALSFLAFIGTTSYAIVKYRLFDIRLAVTRVIGYTLTLGVVAIFYSMVILIISARLTSLSDIGIKELVALLIPTIIVALTFHRVERFIGSHTQHIFYHDAYDTREVLDKLSDALISENNIDSIMQQSLNVIQNALKPSKAYLATLNMSGIVYHHIYTGRDQLPDIDYMLDKLVKENRSLIEYQVDPASNISRAMAKYDMEVVLRLGSRKNPIGLLMLGAKKNGSMYSKKDIDILRISAKNLGIALDNAKKYEQILHFTDTLHQEVNRATSRLRKANYKLKTLDTLKDDFIAAASHQLRTPSASVHDALRMLNHPSITKKERDELIDLAEASSEHLVTVVRTMLNMARLEAGHFTVEKRETDVRKLTERVVDQSMALAEQKDCKISLELPDAPLIMDVDSAKINEALSNYLENAIKYSPVKTVVSLVIQVVDSRVVFEVSDHGIGVPEAERKSMFNKFFRASNARLEHPDGNGIGLYVVKSIAVGHGGDAYYKPGQIRGSIFGFWLPYTKS